MAKQNLSKRIVSFIACPKFFWGILVFFVVQAAWIALSGRYPMAFDEDYHLGIITLYAHHLSPFWSAQPAHADAFGAVFRDPSYLYHWLMSFPYRFISLFTLNETTIILWLRAINIALFAAGLAIYQRLLLKTGASRAIVHGVLLLFVLIPVVPLLGAQINYDNLFLPLIGLLLLAVVRFDEELRKKRISCSLLGAIAILCLLGGLVKYAFLPIALALVVFIIVRIWQVFGSFRKIWAAKRESFKALSLRAGLLLGVGLIISGGLFVERYGVNVARYHNPLPDCQQVLSIEACSHYGPWIRDYTLELNRNPNATKSPTVFAADWLYGMWLRLFFSVDGPGTHFQTRGPLTVPALSAIVFAAGGVVLSLAYAGRLLHKYQAPVLALFLTVSGVYVAVLWLDGYQAFVRTGFAVAINGRYLLPVLPFLMLIGALAFNELCGRRESLKLAIGGVAALCMLWGGGTATYILRSDPNWLWRDQTVVSVNQTVRDALAPVTPGSKDPTTFMHQRN